MRFDPHRNGRSYANSSAREYGPYRLDLGEQRADLLRVAGAAGFADVDVAPLELERRIGARQTWPAACACFGDDGQQLHHAADRGHQQDAEDQQSRIALEPVVQRQPAHARSGSPRQQAARRRRCCLPAKVSREIPGHQDRARQEQQAREEAQQVVRLHRRHHVVEAEAHLAEVIERQPQHALRHAGAPHREHVEHRAGEGQPEMDVREPHAVERRPAMRGTMK